jgi:hypothetical protein
MRLIIAVMPVLMILFGSCQRSQSDGGTQREFVAKAGDDVLDRQEFGERFVSTGLIRDSAYNARKSIEAWATEALFYQEALSKLTKEELFIEKQVEDYRRSLVNYVYQGKMIEANLDTAVSSEEIQNYYDDHRENFILRDNILKVNYLKVPVLAPGLPKIKKLIWAATPKDKEQLEQLCSQNAENFFMNDSTWLFLDDIKKELPALKDQPEYVLHPGKVIEFEDDQYYYYLKVKDVKTKNAYSPINFERQNIRKFILNNRKTQLISQYKQTLLEKAKANKSFVIFSGK